MTTLEEVYKELCEKDPHALVIESQCLKTGCEGDVYRSEIATLKKQLAEDHRNYANWQNRAEKAEKQLELIMTAIKVNMIFRPTDNWQWGYRSGLLAILDVIRPEEGNERSTHSVSG